MPVCKNCGLDAQGNYCSNCGQSLEVKRITLHSIIHEATHLFTHLEKGFLYTIKQLAIHPGTMQLEYIQGHRSKYQKPFSLFFICATIAGLAIYWITGIDSKENMSAFDEASLHFYRHYYVFTQAALIPVYATITWLFFRKKDFNFAESLILLIYTISMSFLIVILTNLVNLIPGDFETIWVELPVLIAYNTWANLNFFHDQPRWVVVLKSVFVLAGCWTVAFAVSNFIIHQFMHH